ncbi:MAG: ATP-binding cassette domain-containing protein [Hungatella hathewayi]
MDKVILKLQGIGKFFASVRVLSDISMEIKEGHVVTLMGENGAGKSTLCKIIAGNYHADSGTWKSTARHSTTFPLTRPGDGHPDGTPGTAGSAENDHNGKHFRGK